MSTSTEPLKREDPPSSRFYKSTAPVAKSATLDFQRIFAFLKRKSVLAVIAVSMGVAALAATGKFPVGGVQTSGALIYHTIKRSDLPITITERGNLESQQNIKILCELDDVEGDGFRGTPILWIIPNGSSVKKGDLLVEFDSSAHRERMDKQILDTTQAQSDKITARAAYENQISQNATTKANAELAVKLAKLELEMFNDEAKGTHKLEVEELKRLIDDVNNEILAAQANRELKRNEKQGIEALFKLGYAGKSELERSRLDYLQSESEYASKMNKLDTQLATLNKKTTYEREMQYLTLDGTLKTAERALDQVELDNQALLEQAKAAMDAANDMYKKENERLERYRAQVEKEKIIASEDGMVTYASGNWRYDEEIREGAAIRPRRHILSLPNLQTMQVETSVHESVVDQVKVGLPATVRIDAFPDRTYRGSVKSVAVLADQNGWQSAHTKVYKTIVTIDEQVEQLKPGMTAVVEIHVDNIKDILSVPIQAIVQVKEKTWCYVESDGIPKLQIVKVGRTNDKFIEILEGLKENDRIVLNPMNIVEQSTQEGETQIIDDDTEEELTPVLETHDSP